MIIKKRAKSSLGMGVCQECGGEFLKNTANQVTCGPPKICRSLHLARYRGGKSIVIPNLECTTCHELKDVRVFLDTPEVYGCADCSSDSNRGKSMSRVTGKKRLCLRCRKPFSSKSLGNRLCVHCNDHNEIYYKTEYRVFKL